MNTSEEDYTKFVESVAHLCHCSEKWGRPCDGVLAGGICDNMGNRDDDLFDDDRVSLAYQEDDSDPHGLGGI